MAWKSSPKVPLLPLQAILLGDLVQRGSPLQIVMAAWRAFLNLKRAKWRAATATPDPVSKKIFFIKVHQTAVIICSCLYSTANNNSNHRQHLSYVKLEAPSRRFVDPSAAPQAAPVLGPAPASPAAALGLGESDMGEGCINV